MSRNLELGQGLCQCFPARQTAIYTRNLLDSSSDDRINEKLIGLTLNLISSRSNVHLKQFLATYTAEKRKSDLSEIFDNSGSESIGRHLCSWIIERKIRISRNVFLRKLVEIIDRNIGLLAPEPLFFHKLQELKSLFKLSDIDADILTLKYCESTFHPFAEIMNCSVPHDHMRLISRALRKPFRSVAMALSDKSPLIVTALLRIGEHEPLRDSNWYQLDSHIILVLNGVTDTPVIDRFCRKDKRPCYALDSFQMPADSLAIIQAIVKSTKPWNLLFYGVAGTGKTEFARALAASTGCDYFMLASKSKLDEKLNTLCQALVIVKHLNAILIVDEADTLLNTDYFRFVADKDVDKGKLNAILDESKNRVIWIVNHTDCMEESVLRRFTYSYHFKNWTVRERERIWKIYAKHHPCQAFLPESTLKQFASSFEVNAAGIATAMNTLKQILPLDKASPDTVKNVLTELVSRHAEAIGKRKTAQLNTVTEHYDVAALNTDINWQYVLSAIRQYLQKRQGITGTSHDNLPILFWGQSGTGKTEFAKYLANECSYSLMLRRASDLISCWVGETEKNIRNVFDQAERDAAILLLDEADSFFINRESAVRSWEVTQTNELLTQMENFKGVLICCTNRLKQLDEAVLRRFVWKIEFKPLTDEGKLSVFNRCFGKDGKALDQSRWHSLLSIPNLTLGDFKTVYNKLNCAGAEQMTQGTIIEALAREVQYRGGHAQKIGFIS